MRGAHFLRGVVERARGIIVRSNQLARGMKRGERRLCFDGQLIERKMFGGFGKRPRQFLGPLLRCLLRPRVNEIERIAFEHAARDRHRIQRLARRMQAPERAKRMIVKRLHAERHAVDAGSAVAAKARGFDAGRIGFEGDFGVGRDMPVPRHRIEHRGDGRRLHQRRRAAAEEDRGDRAAGYALGGRRDLGREGAGEAFLIDRGVADMAVEVAIRAFRQTERPMDIDAESCGLIVQGTPPQA